jgi:hypothetical protein
MTLPHFGLWRAIRHIHGYHETEAMRPTERSPFTPLARACHLMGG